MNTISKLSLRKENNTWVFDDENFGLVNEPFVGDTNLALDYVLNDKDAKTMDIIFSAEPFPEAIELLSFLDRSYGGAMFFCEVLGIECWLCSAMWHYFDEPSFDGTPGTIYIKKI